MSNNNNKLNNSNIYNKELTVPWPYFGGKRRVAATVWQALGADVHTYIEPFLGSGAVLLNRPQPQPSPAAAARNTASPSPRWVETANELNPYVANFFRAVAADPEEVAYYCSYPVYEVDLHARHLWLVQQVGFRELMVSDPDYYDPKIAGWWAWGASSWIADGWCDVADYERRRTTSTSSSSSSNSKTTNPNRTPLSQPVPEMLVNRGVHARKYHGHDTYTPAPAPIASISSSDNNSGKRPRLNRVGGGVHSFTGLGHDHDHDLARPRPRLNRPGVGVNSLMSRRPTNTDNGTNLLLDRLLQIQQRLRYVRILCGDWQRVVSPGAADWRGTVAIFLDPPYVEGGYVYGGGRGGGQRGKQEQEQRNITQEVLDWCIRHWDDPKLRIAYCGWEGELDVPNHWRKYCWASNGIKARSDKNGGNRHRERIWFSPACLTSSLGEGADSDSDSENVQLSFELN